MKKILVTLLCVLIICCVSGCNNVKTINEIETAKLTEDQEEILDLVGLKRDVNIYNYNIDDSFKTINIWLETYHNGKLISPEGKNSFDIDGNKGKLALIVETKEKYKWQFSIKNDSKLVTLGSNESDLELKKDFIIGISNLDGTIDIEDNKEIVLNTCFCKKGESMTSHSDMQHYVNHPEALKQYDCAYILKCEFTTKTVPELNKES